MGSDYGYEKTRGFESVNRAFSKQSVLYDQEDAANPILTTWRKLVYQHVDLFIRPNSRILELNAGTGIDAMHFASQGHSVHCTDVSDGMIDQIRGKIEHHALQARITCQPCSFESLNEVAGSFDYVFSNFGGLNCTDDLAKVARHLAGKVNRGGFVTWVIMPPVSPWEISWALKGHFRAAFRRLSKKGVMAHLEGEHFRTCYFSLPQVADALGHDYQLRRCEGLGALSPPPSAFYFPDKHPVLYPFLSKLDNHVRVHFPFNRWADHLIMTFEKVR